MPDLWMDVDTALSEVPVNITPLIDATDFKTIEDAVAYNAAGLALYWHFVTSAGAYTVTAVTPTTAGTYDWTDQGAAGIYTIEIPASGGASINNDTEGFGWFTGVATGVLPWRGPVIGFRAAALNDALIDSAWSTTRGLAGTALPNAAADAAGGLAISDAGGLDLDSKLAATNEVTAARMGALTDWINGGRLDLLLDAIKAVTDLLPNGGALTNLDAAISSRLASASYSAPPSAAANADAVWDEALSGHLSAGSTGEALNAAGAAGDPWTTSLPGAYGAGSAGKIIGDNINATISSRAAASALATAQTDLDTLTGADGATLATAQGNYAPSKAGDAMALTSSERTTLAAAIWNAATSGMTTAGSIGKKLADWTIHSAADVWAVATRVLTAATNITSTGGTTVPQTGDAYARLGAPAGASVSADVAAVKVDTAAIKVVTDQFVFTVANRVDANARSVGGTSQTGGDLAALVSALTLYASRTVIRGTVGSATTPSTTQFTPSALSPSGSAADQFKGRILVFDNDTATAALRGQATDITASSAAALPLLTFTALTTAPASGDTFSIV